MDESTMRLAALEMACNYADDPQEAMAIADTFVEYIDGNAANIRFECGAKVAKIIND